MLPMGLLFSGHMVKGSFKLWLFVQVFSAQYLKIGCVQRLPQVDVLYCFQATWSKVEVKLQIFIQVLSSQYLMILLLMNFIQRLSLGINFHVVWSKGKVKLLVCVQMLSAQYD